MSPRRTLRNYGERGRSVRVFAEKVRSGNKLIRVQWREEGRLRTESRPDTPENRESMKAYAEGVADRLRRRIDAPPPPITLAELYSRYVLANADHWRPSTRTNSDARWKKFTAFATPSLQAHRVTASLLDEFRAEMKKPGMAKGQLGHAINQIVEHVKVVKAVFRFGKARRLLAENPIAEYTIRLAKDERRLDTHEYTPAEWSAILGQLSPRKALEWRPYCLVLLAGLLGPRQKALRSLQWANVDITQRTVTWPAWSDKLGHERTQPLPRDAVRVFRIARVWRFRDRFEGPWVFYGAQDRTRSKPYGAQALIQALHVAADKAGVPRVKWRAMHGLRRTSAGNVLDLTGDVKAAADWLGDTDLRVMTRYLKTREVKQRDLASRLSAPETVTKTQPEPAAPRNPRVKS